MVDMLRNIVNMLRSVSELMINLVKFIPKLLKDLVMCIDLVLQAVSRLPDILVIFPGVISSLILSIFAVAVIYKVLGREG